MSDLVGKQEDLFSCVTAHNCLFTVHVLPFFSKIEFPKWEYWDTILILKLISLYCISTDKAKDTRYNTTVALKKMRMTGEKNGW